MLVKVTNQCGMRCSHCMEDSRPNSGQHMSVETFRAALDCVRRTEILAHQLGYRFVLLSGGECTEHPEFLKILAMVEEAGFVPLLITNGMWLNDPYLREHILRPGRMLRVQVTNDVRFYPEAPPVVTQDERIVRIQELTRLEPLGRAKRLRDTGGLQERMGPGSFNFRSLVRSTKDIRKALLVLRARAMAGGGGHCTPSISHDGSFMAGESRLCARVGTVDSSCEELTEGVLRMGSCNQCGLESKLNAGRRAAIGLEAT